MACLVLVAGLVALAGNLILQASFHLGFVYWKLAAIYSRNLLLAFGCIYCQFAVGLLAIGYWLLAIGFGLLEIGFWLLDIGNWQLAIGYLLLTFFSLLATLALFVQLAILAILAFLASLG
jgi:hypothetical protein